MKTELSGRWATFLTTVLNGLSSGKIETLLIRSDYRIFKDLKVYNLTIINQVSRYKVGSILHPPDSPHGRKCRQVETKMTHLENKGNLCRKPVGTWFGPNTVAQVLRKLCLYDPRCVKRKCDTYSVFILKRLFTPLCSFTVYTH